MTSLAAMLGTPLASSSNSWLITPNVGLTIWTLVVFRDLVVHPQQGGVPADSRRARPAARQHRRVDRRRRSAPATEAEKILAEYRERLKEARAQSEEIVQRARQTAESHEHEGRERGQEILAEAAKRAERDIEAATKRALDDIRREVADLTIMATEKVTRKTLNDADQRRLVEEALGELDFSSISSGAENN